MDNINITKGELERAYTTMTVDEAMVLLNIGTQTTFYRLLNKAGIPRKDPTKSAPGKVKTRFHIVD